MGQPGPNELIVIRHAPADSGGRLAGRKDVPALLPDPTTLTTLRTFLQGCRFRSSPALRCRMTARTLMEGDTADCPEDPRLWEQDFGDHEGLPYDARPDLGPLDREALAAHRPPAGESYADMVARVHPALIEIAQEAASCGPIAVIAHAGTARAALDLALGRIGQGLAFDIAPLSLTRLVCLENGFAIRAVNQQMTPIDD